MLDQKDLQAIGSVMDEKIKSNNKELSLVIDEKFKSNNKELLFAVGEMVEHNIMPVMDKIVQRLDSLERTVSELPTKDYVDKKIANLPNKQYLDDKLADSVSDTVKLFDKRLTQRDKIDRTYKTTVTEVIEEHDLATPSQLSTLKKSITLNNPLTA